jgi:hypothetical protein
MHRQKPWITGGAILIVLLIASSLMLDIASGTQPHAPDDDFWSYIPFVSQGEPAATATRPPSPSPTASPQPTGGPTSTRPPAGSIVVDHTSVALFEQIPEQYLNAASAILPTSRRPTTAAATSTLFLPIRSTRAKSTGAGRVATIVATGTTYSGKATAAPGF